MQTNARLRRDRLIKQKRNDSYRCKGKPPEPTLCAGCGSVFVRGRWTWDTDAAENAVNRSQCPACRRTEENMPAGEIELKGDFLREHGNEIVNGIRNIEKHEQRWHPLERIITFQDQEDSTFLTTTGVHLARRIGDGLHRAFKGELNYSYAQDEQNIRVSWSR